jgi:hypothetical protein
MLLIVLALFWVALLAPVVIRRIRDGGTERSILSFHAEHEVLSRQDYTVMPAHRLDRPDEFVSRDREPESERERRPRLTIVHPDDTVGTLASRSTWDEWSENYDYDDTQVVAPVVNRYARAYSSRPSEPELVSAYEPPLRRRTMRAQRRVMFARCVAVAVVITLIAFVSGSSLVTDLAALAWFAVVLFVALALYSVSQGYLDESSLGLRWPQRRPLAVVQPLYQSSEPDYEAPYEPVFVSEFYEPETEEPWRRESQGRRAFG